MELRGDNLIQQFKWYIVAFLSGLVVVILLAMFTDVFRTTEGSLFLQPLWLLGGLVALLVLVMVLTRLDHILGLLHNSSDEHEKLLSALEKGNAVLLKINQNTRLSEKAKAIASRDIDNQALREAVFSALQQQDFEATSAMIDEISKVMGDVRFAEQLRADADRYRGATKEGRINQIVAHIDKLLDNYQWAAASAQIERLIKAEPGSEKAKAMRQQLIDKKEERKKVLLTAWDDAVKRQATDRSLEILRELDAYLTPNEGLALQEAARDVFRNKLHSLGVQFSLAVSGKKWDVALRAGRQIMHDFPNSKMAQEIRERFEILTQKVASQQRAQ